jgi:hypothetical protein
LTRAKNAIKKIWGVPIGKVITTKRAVPLSEGFAEKKLGVTFSPPVGDKKQWYIVKKSDEFTTYLRKDECEEEG